MILAKLFKVSRKIIEIHKNTIQNYNKPTAFNHEHTQGGDTLEGSEETIRGHGAAFFV